MMRLPHKFKLLTNFLLSLSLTSLAITFSSCTWLESFFSKPDAVQEGLTEEQAKARASIVSNVKYDLAFHLEKDEKTFSGKTEISFDLKRKVPRIRVDLTGGKVHSVRLNGEKIETKYNDHFIDVASDKFKVGANKISVNYDMRYSTFGAGLYRFEDPKDKNVYVYSDFEPYDANRLFPCFDQPDLKATYKTKVSAPKSWEVVTSVRETETKTEEDRKIWSFPESAKFSTYIYSLHAGPYHIWEDKDFRYPLRLMVRQTMKDYVQSEEWFKYTKQGFDYFDEYFGYPYPFVKYDQVIVPDFNSGAMENVAAVTFSERYLRKGAYTYNDKMSIASVVLHEMAHMWFGNLVTMKWWNDLWLNESFASIMAARGLDQATEFKTSWQRFYTDMKQWAYWEDQLATSHPIETNVPSTVEAFANFDGITYGKGASVLKQIIYYLGEEGFQKGIQSYFKTHAYQNTILDNFITALEGGSGKKLDWWSKDWLQTKGVNTIAVNFQCTDGKVTKSQLTQTSSLNAPGLRRHKTQIALMNLNKEGKLEKTQTLAVEYAKKNTPVEEMIGLKCPDAVYPNDLDFDYVQVKLDDKTLSTIQNHVKDIDDVMLRTMMWRNLWDMVRNQQLPVQSYLDLVANNIAEEQDIGILRSVLSTIGSRRGTGSTALWYYPVDESDKKSVALKFEYRKRLEDLAWTKLNETIDDTNAHLLWFQTYSSMARSKKGLDQLKIVLLNGEKYKTINANQDLRWRILWHLNTYSLENVTNLVKQEAQKDKSDTGQNMLIAIDAAQNAHVAKKTFYRRLVDPKSGDSVKKQKVIAGSLFPPGQHEHRMAFAKNFFDDVVKLSKDRNEVFLGTFVSQLAPVNCTADAQKTLHRFLENHKNLKETITRRLRKSLEEDERCLKIRNYSAQSKTRNTTM